MVNGSLGTWDGGTGNEREEDAETRQGLDEERIFMKLLINPEGKIDNAEILNNPRVDYASEALIIVRKLPNFVTGKQKGKPIYVYYNFPIKFNAK